MFRPATKSLPFQFFYFHRCGSSIIAPHQTFIRHKCPPALMHYERQNWPSKADTRESKRESLVLNNPKLNVISSTCRAHVEHNMFSIACRFFFSIKGFSSLPLSLSLFLYLTRLATEAANLKTHAILRDLDVIHAVRLLLLQILRPSRHVKNYDNSELDMFDARSISNFRM